MTARLHTPVVVSEDQEIRSEALRRGWRVVTRHPANPQVLMLSGCGTPCGIPQPTMSIFHGSLDPESLPVWRYVLNWLTRFVHNPLLVVQADDYLTDLALWASATRNWPIGAIVTHPLSQSAQAYALHGSAVGFLSLAGTGLEPELEDEPLVLVQSTADMREPEQAGTIQRDHTRVLVVGYPTTDDPESSRTFQWARELSARGLDTDLALPGRKRSSTEGRIHRIPDLGQANLVTSEAPLSASLDQFVRFEQSRPFQIRETVGGMWGWAFERYFDRRRDEYDVVIIVGPPCGYFDIASYAHRKWYARVVLDYESPLPEVIDPAVSEDARDVAKGWNFNADLIVVRDRPAAEAVVRSSPDQRVEVPDHADLGGWMESRVTGLAAHTFFG